MGRLWIVAALACALAAAGMSATSATPAPAPAAPAARPAGTVVAGPAAGLAPAARTTRPRDECGKRPRKPSGKYWRCTFVDRFEGDRLDGRKWFKQRRNTQLRRAQCQWAGPRHVAVRGGALRLTVRRTKNKACAFASGSVSTYHRFSQRYGIFEAKVRVRRTTERGLQEAFWLWPDARFSDDTPWPAAGEIDVVETYSQFPDLAVPFLHYTANNNGGPRPGLNTARNCKMQRGRWNVYRLVWGPDRIRISVNGRTCLVNRSGDRAFKKRYIIALTQAAGIGRNKPTSRTPFPATMSVDYVKVWR